MHNMRTEGPGRGCWTGVVILLGVLLGTFPGFAAGSANSAEVESGSRPEFSVWLASFRAEAERQGISSATLHEALTDIEPRQRIIELDRHQPEGRITFQQYLDRVINRARVLHGRKQLRTQSQLLARIHAAFGVQPRFLVALWGIESDFGRRTGGFKVIEALATLAYDGRRGSFYRGQLIDALRILDEGHIAAPQMVGSWAGAMGQPQFMPSTFRNYAVDFDGDQRRNIWGNTADALASAANYLSSVGWRSDVTWGREVRLTSAVDPELVGRKITRPLSTWQAMGVRRRDGSDLPRRNLAASLVQPGGAAGPSYLVYENYQYLMEWNRSDYFATAIGILSDQLVSP